MSVEKLKAYVRESNAKLLANFTVEQCIKGMTVDEIIRAISPETRKELIRLLEERDSLPKPDIIVTANPTSTAG